MSNSIAYFFIIGITFSLLECKPKNDVPKTIVLPGDYKMPKPGSTLAYIESFKKVPDTTQILNYSIRDTIFDSIQIAFGKNFRIIHRVFHPNRLLRFYECYKDGNYYYLNETSLGFEEYIYLKDSIEVGKKWETHILGLAIPDHTTHEIIENNLNMSIKGRVFKKVIHKRTRNSNGISDYYYAPSIGLIKYEYSVGSKKHTVELESFEIK